MALIKEPELSDFKIVSYVPWHEIRSILGLRRYRRFQNWIRGEECHKEGAYPHDLKQFLKVLPTLD